MEKITRCILSVLLVWFLSPKDLLAQDDLFEVAMSGFHLSIAECEELEAQVVANPDHKNARLKLVGYYLNKKASARSKHVLWVIEKFPASQLAGSPFCGFANLTSPSEREGYAAGAILWERHTKGISVVPDIVLNAASYFTNNDQAKAEAFLRRGIQAFPADTRFSIDLARILERDPARVDESFALFEKSLLATTNKLDRFYLLSDVAKAALGVGDLEKAKNYATELLEAAARNHDWNTGNAIHHGNLVLGRVVLRNGDLKQACVYLLKAGESKGSPQLDSFGPNLLLARELLEKGEREAVLAYLDKCEKFWKDPRVDVWRKSIMAGIIPDFGANLYY